MSFDPTPEQLAIIAAGKETNDSLLINALAGAAKTSTLVLLSHKLPLVPAISVAFNKRTADEMGKRLPGHISCSTLNSLGHRVWGQKLGKRLRVESGKVFDLAKAHGDRLKGEDQKAFRADLAATLRAVGLAKALGYVPDKFTNLGKSLVTQEELVTALDSQIDANVEDFFLSNLDSILEVSIAQAFDGTIDFNDQIYMSTLFGGKYPRYPIVMVDEAQDLSPLNHESLAQMVGGRLIAVGDPNQSIYGFRGAHTSSMEFLKHRFDMRELSLSVSFRCPVAVVERARVRAPHMQAPTWAKPGHVERLEAWTAASIPDGAAIICRNNAPLFKAALNLIKSGRGIRLIGADIGKQLVKILEKLGEGNPDRVDLHAALLRWRDGELRRAKREAQKDRVHDKYECLCVFVDAGKDKRDAVSFAEAVFAANGPIELMSGHKSKGLEFDCVYYLDSFLLPSRRSLEAADLGDDSALEQERNLNYVILTRSKDRLFFIDSKGFA